MTTATTATAVPAPAPVESRHMLSACTRQDCTGSHATYQVTLADRVQIAVRGRDTAGTRALDGVLVVVHDLTPQETGRELVSVLSEVYRAAMGHRDPTAYRGAVAIDALGWVQVYGREVGRIDVQPSDDDLMALVDATR